MNITREMPNAKHNFLRFQIGRMERRFEQIPLYIGKKLIGHKKGSTLVPVFRLIGFGSTLEKAEDMEKRAA